MSNFVQVCLNGKPEELPILEIVGANPGITMCDLCVAVAEHFKCYEGDAGLDKIEQRIRKQLTEKTRKSIIYLEMDTKEAYKHKLFLRPQGQYFLAYSNHMLNNMFSPHTGVVADFLNGAK